VTAEQRSSHHNLDNILLLKQQKREQTGKERGRRRNREQGVKGNSGKGGREKEGLFLLQHINFSGTGYASRVNFTLVLHISACLCITVWKFPGSDKPS